MRKIIIKVSFAVCFCLNIGPVGGNEACCNVDCIEHTETCHLDTSHECKDECIPFVDVDMSKICENC